MVNCEGQSNWQTIKENANSGSALNTLSAGSPYQEPHSFVQHQSEFPFWSGMLMRAVKLISTAAIEAQHPNVREGWWQYKKVLRILEEFIIKTRREIELVQYNLGSCLKAGPSQDGIKRCKCMTCQQVQERNLQLRKYLVQMEGTQTEIVEPLIRQGDPTEVVCAESNGNYCQSSQEIAGLQEEVKEVVEALKEIRSALAKIETDSSSKQCEDCRKA